MDSESKLINPYSLLGVKNVCTISELKKNYYNLSLLTHPDKGGSKEDFNIVNLAYNYIKKQIENIRDVTYEELEDEFEKFCKEQESIKPPCFYEVYKETNDWLNEFNKEFEKKNNQTNNEYEPFEKGYGSMLDKSEIELEYKNNEIKKISKNIKNELIKYNEPTYLPDSINYYPLDNEEIKDFSSLNGNGNLDCYDYKISHAEKNNLDEEMQKLEINYNFVDYPKDNLEYKAFFNLKK